MSVFFEKNDLVYSFYEETRMLRKHSPALFWAIGYLSVILILRIANGNLIYNNQEVELYYRYISSQGAINPNSAMTVAVALVGLVGWQAWRKRKA